MSRPKGFGKNYFTLLAIQAYSTQVTLTRHVTVAMLHHQTCTEDDDIPTLVEEDPLWFLESQELESITTSYCAPHAAATSSSVCSHSLHVNSTLPLKEYV